MKAPEVLIAIVLILLFMDAPTLAALACIAWLACAAFRWIDNWASGFMQDGVTDD